MHIRLLCYSYAKFIRLGMNGWEDLTTANEQMGLISDTEIVEFAQAHQNQIQQLVPEFGDIIMTVD